MKASPFTLGSDFDWASEEEGEGEEEESVLAPEAQVLGDGERDGGRSTAAVGPSPFAPFVSASRVGSGYLRWPSSKFFNVRRAPVRAHATDLSSAPPPPSSTQPLRRWKARSLYWESYFLTALELLVERSAANAVRLPISLRPALASPY